MSLGETFFEETGRYVFSKMKATVRSVNEANGWHDGGRTFGEGIALLHSEVSEALEAFRDHGLADVTAPAPTRHTSFSTGELPPSKPEGVGSEFADVLIRLIDECDRQGIDLFAEYLRKIEYNKTRGYKHGGKAL